MKSESTIIDSIPLLVQKRFVSAKLNSFKEIQNAKFTKFLRTGVEPVT